jgi:uncharacterized protein HemX
VTHGVESSGSVEVRALAAIAVAVLALLVIALLVSAGGMLGQQQQAVHSASTLAKQQA